MVPRIGALRVRHRQRSLVGVVVVDHDLVGRLVSLLVSVGRDSWPRGLALALVCVCVLSVCA